MAQQQKKNKGVKRSAGAHKAQYTAQFAITRRNKIIRMAGHCGRALELESRINTANDPSFKMLFAMTRLELVNARTEAKRRGNLAALRAFDVVAQRI